MIKWLWRWRSSAENKNKDKAGRASTTPSLVVVKYTAESYDQGSAQDNDGLKLLSDPKDADVDIVAIHGLSGHREATWTYQGQGLENPVLWLRDLLPLDVPTARIMTFGYDSQVTSARYLTQRILYSRSQNLLEALDAVRKDPEARQRPIIFLAHSLGGIVLKSALIFSSMDNSRFRELYLSTAGVLFFGTPHQGSDTATWDQIMKKIVSLSTNLQSIQRTLDSDLHWLQLQQEQYKTIAIEIGTYCYFESNTGGHRPISSQKSAPIVPFSSAVPTELFTARNYRGAGALDSDHRDMVRFADRNGSGYRKVLTQIDLLYRDGKKLVACKRLQDELNKELVSRSISIEDDFCIPPILPAKSNNSFFGRKDELDLLHRRLSLSERHSVVPISGIGGIGKTKLALEYGHQYKQCFTSIFWVNAQSSFSLYTSVLEIANQLKKHYAPKVDLNDRNCRQMLHYLSLDGLVDDNGELKASEETPQLLFDAVQKWLGRAGNDRWLLILDNADDPDVFAAKGFTPSHLLGRVIVTSRNPFFKGQKMELRGLEEDDCVQLLHHMCNNLVFSDRSDEVNLINKLDRLPLAITLAAAYLSHQGIPLTEYVRLFSEAEHVPRKGDRMAMPTHSVPSQLESLDSCVLTTWRLSLNAIREKNRSAERLLTSFAFLSDNEIPTDFVDRSMQESGNYQETSLDDILWILNQFSLIHHDTNTKMVSLNSLLRLWLQEEGRSDPTAHRDDAKFACSLVCSGLRSIRNSIHILTPEQWFAIQKTQPHIAECGKWTDVLSADDVDWKVLGNVCQLQGDHDLARKFYQVVEPETPFDPLNTTRLLQELRAAEEGCGPNHNITLDLTYRLASGYQEEGQHDKAEIFLRRTATARHKLFGPEHPLTLKTSEKLGIVLQQQGKYRQAESMYRAIHAATAKTMGENHPNTAKLQGNIAVLLTLERRFVEANDYYKEALAKMEKVFGLHHSEYKRLRENYNINIQEESQERVLQEIACVGARVLTPSEVEQEDVAAGDNIRNLGARFSKSSGRKESESSERDIMPADIMEMKKRGVEVLDSCE